DRHRAHRPLLLPADGRRARGGSAALRRNPRGPPEARRRPRQRVALLEGRFLQRHACSARRRRSRLERWRHAPSPAVGVTRRPAGREPKIALARTGASGPCDTFQRVQRSTITSPTRTCRWVVALTPASVDLSTVTR